MASADGNCFPTNWNDEDVKRTNFYYLLKEVHTVWLRGDCESSENKYDFRGNPSQYSLYIDKEKKHVKECINKFINDVEFYPKYVSSLRRPSKRLISVCECIIEEILYKKSDSGFFAFYLIHQL